MFEPAIVSASADLLIAHTTRAELAGDPPRVDFAAGWAAKSGRDQRHNPHDAGRVTIASRQAPIVWSPFRERKSGSPMLERFCRREAILARIRGTALSGSRPCVANYRLTPGIRYSCRARTSTPRRRT